MIWIGILTISLYGIFVGPPGQVAAIAGKKAGMKQGELGGVLKELGYTEDQVCSFASPVHLPELSPLCLYRSINSRY